MSKSKDWTRLTYDGDTKTYVEWAKDPRCKVKASTLRQRIDRGMPAKEAITTPAINQRSIMTGAATHGNKHYKLYKTWAQIKIRTTNKNARNYITTDLKGDRLAPEWMEFEAFAKWALSNGWTPEYMIHRRCSDYGYTPANCYLEKGKYFPNADYYCAFNERKLLTMWILDSRCKAGFYTVKHRLRMGWSFQDAISTPGAVEKTATSRYQLILENAAKPYNPVRVSKLSPEERVNLEFDLLMRTKPQKELSEQYGISLARVVQIGKILRKEFELPPQWSPSDGKVVINAWKKARGIR